MLMVALAVASVAADASPTACPRQAEPSALTSAAFAVPPIGETLLFSAAPSFQSVRYALRVVRYDDTQDGTAVLIRLKRRWDCNVHDRAGLWSIKLSAGETKTLFAAASAVAERWKGEPSATLDGTSVEVRRFGRGQPTLTYGSNDRSAEHFSNTVLAVLRGHVPEVELPRTSDWRYKLPGTKL